MAGDYLPPVVVEVIMRTAGVAEGAAKVKAEVAGMSDGISASTGKAASDVDKNASKIEDRSSTMGKKLSSAFQSAGSSIGGAVGAPLVKVGEQMDQTGSKADSLTSKLASIGKVATIGGLAGFAAAAYEGVKAAEGFQTSLASIAANSGIAQKAADGIGQAFLGTMGKSVFSAQQMASAFASVAGQLKLTEGHALSAAEAEKVMAAAGDLAEASHESLATSTSALSSVMQAYHLSVSQAAQGSDLLFNVSKSLNVPISGVASAADKLHARLGTLAPTMGDVGGLMVDLGEHGIQGQRGIQVVNTALQTLVGGSSTTMAALKALGVDIFNSQGKFIGLQGVISQLQPKLAGLTQQQQLFVEKSLFGASAAQVMGQVIAGGVPQFQAATAAATKLGTAHQAAALQSKTLHDQMELLKATVDDLGVKFGMVLIPILENVAKTVSSVIGWFDKHRAAAEALAGVIGGVLATAVTVFAVQKLAGLVTSLAQGVAALGKFAGSVVDTAGSVVAKFAGIGAASTTTAETVATESGAMETSVTGLGTITSEQATSIDASLARIAAAFPALEETVGTEIAAIDGQMSLFADTVATEGAAIEATNTAVGLSFTALLGPIGLVAAAAGGLLYLGSKSGPGPVGGGYGNPVLGTGRPGNAALVGTPGAASGGNAPVTGSGIGGLSLSDLEGMNATAGSTGAGGVWTGAGGQVTQTSFAASLLSRLGDKTSSAAIQDLTAWMQQEGGAGPQFGIANNHANYNPLNTTESEAGATNQAGGQGNIKSYTSWAQGLAATVATLTNGKYNSILSALKSGESLSQFSSALAGTPWGTGAIDTSGQKLGNAQIQALMNANASGTSTSAAKKTATYGPSQNVENMLTLAQQLVGAPYSKAGHASAYDETVAQIKKFGTDCSGLVSVLLKEGVSGIRAAQTTQGLPTAAGLAPGTGKYVTVYDRHTGPTDDEHTLIDILGKYFESGGNAKYNPTGGISELTTAQAAGELAGGGFQAYHPTASYLNTAVKGGASTTFSGTADAASLQTAINQFIGALKTQLTNAISSGTPKSLEKTLGVSTGGGVAGKLTTAMDKLDPVKIENAIKAGKQPSSLDKAIIPILQKSSDYTSQVVAELKAGGHGNVASEVGAAFSTLAQSLYAQQATKNADSLKLQAQQETDQTTLTADSAKDQLAVVTDGQNLIVQQMTAAATAIKDTTQSITDSFQAMATSIQDAIATMSDSSNAVVQGIQNQAQIQVDTLGETGKYGFGLLAQQETVQLDVLKAGFDQQIAAAQANVDATKAQWDATIAGLQQTADQTQLQQDQLVATAQQAETMVQMQQDQLVATAQSHADSVALAQDIKVNLAQTAVDLSTNSSAAQQKITQAALTMAQSQQSKANADAQATLSAVQNTAATQENLAENTYNLAQQTAATQEATAAQALATAQGTASVQEAYAAQALQTVQDTAAQQEATAQAQIDVTNAQQSALESGGGTFNPYSTLLLGAGGSMNLIGGGGPLPYAGAYSAGGEGGSGSGGSGGGTTTVNQQINLQSSADPASLATEMLWLLKPYLAIS